MVGSRLPDQIWEDEPQEGHRLSRGWKTVNGYLRESKELAVCLGINARLTTPYPLEAVIKFTGQMAVDEHNEVWKRYKRNMKAKGITALWVREPSKNNNVHYHLILSAPDAPEAAEDALRTACPKGYQGRLHLHLERIRDQTATVYYVCKAKVAGYDPIRKRMTSDKWAGKRLYFDSWVTLQKYGSVGPFWHTPKAKLWKGVIERERGINLHLADVSDDARKLAELTGVPLLRVKRSLAYFRWRERSRRGS